MQEKDSCMTEAFLKAVAPILKQKIAFTKPLLEKFGEPALKILRETVQKETFKEWQDLAEQEGDTSMENLVDLLWNRLCLPLGFQFTITPLPGEEEPSSIQIHCTRCPLYEYAKKLGDLELGFEFHCAQDPFIAEAFGEDIGFRQTKWLMRGDDYCDHYYYMKRTDNKIKT